MTSPGWADGKDRAQQAPQAIVVRRDEGESIPAAGVEHTFLLGSDRSQGRLSVEQFTVPPGQTGAVPHVHGDHDECFYVLSGELTVQTASGDHTLQAGDLAYAPLGSVHGFRNDHHSELAIALCISTPAGYEGFFREVRDAEAKGEPLIDEAMRGLRAAYNTTTL